MPLCASTCTVPPVNGGCSADSKLAGLPCGIGSDKEIEPAAKATLPVTVKVPMRHGHARRTTRHRS